MKFALNFFVVFVAIFFVTQIVNAEIQRVSVGEEITIGEFIYDDDYVRRQRRLRRLVARNNAKRCV